jgi:hypothetical protein
MKIELMVFWIIALCSMVDGYQLLEDLAASCRLRWHSPPKHWYPTTTLHGTSTQKAAISTKLPRNFVQQVGATETTPMAKY